MEFIRVCIVLQGEQNLAPDACDKLYVVPTSQVTELCCKVKVLKEFTSSLRVVCHIRSVWDFFLLLFSFFPLGRLCSKLLNHNCNHRPSDFSEIES